MRQPEHHDIPHPESHPDPNLDAEIDQAIASTYELIYNYHDWRPVQIHRGNGVTYQYQKGWFSTLVGRIQLAESLFNRKGKTLPPELQHFVQRYISNEFKRQEFMTKENVLEARLTISILVLELAKLNGKTPNIH